MAKNRDIKKEGKKKPKLTAKEKRLKKLEKKRLTKTKKKTPWR